MQKEPKLKTIYYCDELNDDFAGTNINQKILPDSFRYVNKNIFYKIGEKLLSVFVHPFIFIFNKITYHQKFVDKKKLKQVKNCGYFIYGNHTNALLDAFTPSLIDCLRKTFIIVNPDATSIKGIRTIVMMLGALPLPNNSSLKNEFLEAIKVRIEEKKVICIYPEAHIWPFYTDVRHFKPDSFIYPVNMNKPVFAFTNVYKKRIFLNKPRVVTYIDGPFFPDPSLSKRQNMENLRDEVYTSMKKRISQSKKYEYKYKYIKNSDN